ncbi:unnamed protein product [Blepharisma stoltei]|uniref:Tetratricopeptide repeat protein n=1 Tax=Blepharisma stoltei TaxID=1481888 RepID=A0AAU9IQU8_9CILI|nr:unnamed protein product [Blepharisma stoltei]
MIAKKCFGPGCVNEVGYACKCSSPETLSCEVHAVEHANLPNRSHNLESIFMQPCEGTKEAILEFLTKENSKYSELRRKIIESFSQRLFISEKDLGDFKNKLDCCSDEINDFFAKISQATKLLKSEQDPILRLLSLQPQEAIEKVNLMTIPSREWYKGAKLFYIFNQKLDSLNRSFFTEICGAYLEKKNMQNIPEMYNKIIKSANIESENVKDLISLIINENSETLKDPENVNKPIKNNSEIETSLHNSQISTVSNDLNRKPNETESTLNAIGTLRNKAAEILSRPNRTAHSAIKTNTSFYDPPLMKSYQDYINAYQQKTSLYNITADDKNNRTCLHIYKTETETQEVKILQTPQPLDSGTCITQFPNDKLFCYGNNLLSGITVLIDANGGAEVLPSGTPCSFSSCIYLNNSVYCFGGFSSKLLTLSSRFDLDRNRWIHLTPIPRADCLCNSVIFNGNILISGYENSKILLYSIDIDSFSTIPYEFEEEKRKILINLERLYLIECSYGSIYESEIGSYSNWRRIGKSAIDYPFQVYCSYNKGFICISTISSFSSAREYYYFNLDQKIIIDVAYYNTRVSLRRVGKKIEAIKCNKQYKLDPYYLDECNVKGIALNALGKKLEAVECYDEAIKLNPKDADLYSKKGIAFYDLRRYLEAIECYDEAIKLNPNDAIYSDNKGNVLYRLGRYLEAIECYDEAIKRNPNDVDLYNHKGNAFYSLGRYLEAIKCYDEAIKLNPNNADFYILKGNAFYEWERYLKAIECYDEAINFDPNNADLYWKKGYALNELGRYPEAVKSYNKAIKIKPYKAKFYNAKGNTLYALERYQGAIQCYNKAIKLKPNNPLHFCNRARVFNDLRKEAAALQDFNRAYNLKKEYQESDAFTGDEWKLSEKDINFINDVLGRDRVELLQKSRLIKFGYNKLSL